MSPIEFKRQFIDQWKATSLVNIEGVWFKCEFENPTGSIKSRGLVWQIYWLNTQNIHEAVISSSGNAAIAATYYGQKAGIQIHVFVPKTISPEKTAMIRTYTKSIIITEHASAYAKEYAEKNKIPLIRQSIDPHAQEGFESLAIELKNQLEQKSIHFSDTNIFFPVSSGTTIAGFYQGIKRNRLETPQLHIVQNEAVNLIAKEFDSDFTLMAHSIVPGIVARKEENTYKYDVLRAIEQSKGWGWIVPDQQILKAKQSLEDHALGSSLEGAMAYAGYLKAKHKGYALYENSVIILT